MKLNSSVSVSELYDAQQHYFEVNYDRWVNDVLFSFNWWFLLVVMIVPILIWWRLLDKSRMMEIIIVGLYIGGIASTLDMIGIVLSIWTYKYKLIQFYPPFNPVDFSLLPVAYMLLYQWAAKWKPFIIILIFAAVFGSFVAEPIFIWMGIYDQTWWIHSYSFPFYIVMGISAKAIIEKIKGIQNKNNRADLKYRKENSKDERI